MKRIFLFSLAFLLQTVCVADLFPDLARSMREVEFLHATDPATGAMDFRVALPLGSKRSGIVAADGQMGCIQKVRRDWMLAKKDPKFDADGWLRRLWPNVRKAEMIFQGMDADAEKVVRAIRDRHDGLKRNPFSEPECGHNYARSMAAWNCLLAWRLTHAKEGE